MNIIGLGMAFTFSILTSSISSTHNHKICQGIIPENDLSIPAEGWTLKRADGVDEKAFHQILDKVERVYNPIFSSKGESFTLERNWHSDVVNAYATRSWGRSIVAMFGGLARHPEVTKDAFMLVACHEIGHHIGGAPKNNYSWSTNEGQADYFGNLKCMRQILHSEDNISYIKKLNVPAVVRQTCQQNFSDSNEVALCIRTSLAGKSLALFFDAVKEIYKYPDFNTPDTSVAQETYNGHPAPQCRLDTYFSGSICEVDYRQDVNSRDHLEGVCSKKKSYTSGIRPSCWYKSPY